MSSRVFPGLAMLSIPPSSSSGYSLSSSSRVFPRPRHPGILSPCHPGHPPSSSSRAFSLLVILSAAKDLFPSQPPAAGKTDPSSLTLLRMTGGGTPLTSGIAAVLLHTVRRLSFWALLCTVLGISLSSSFRVFPHPRHPGILSPCHPERSEGSFSVPVSSCRGNRSFVAAAPQDDRGGGTPLTSGIAAVLLHTVRRLSFWTLLSTILAFSYLCHPRQSPSSSSRAFSLLVILSAAKDLFPSQSPAAGETDPSSLPLLRMTGGGAPLTSGIAAVLLHTVRRLSFWALLCTVLGISLSSSFRVFPHPRHPGILSPCHPERSEGSFFRPSLQLPGKQILRRCRSSG